MIPSTARAVHMNVDTSQLRRAAMTARLDRLPTTRYIWTLLLLLSLGGCFEFYDLFLMTYIGPGLVRSGLFDAASVSFFGARGFASFVAATFGGLFIGTLVFGFAADAFGRRAIFTGSLLWYTAASVVMAFQSTAPSILLWRTIAGVGIGVEIVTIDTYIAELMPRELRGRAFAINQVVQFSAVPIVAFVSWWLVPLSPLGLDGWRWVVLLGSVSAVGVWFIRRGVPESPRWLIARGRLVEAERVVAAMEQRVAKEVGGALAAPGESVVALPVPEERSLWQIFRRPYAARTTMLMVFHVAQTVGYYGFASWVPTLLISAGITTTASLKYSFVIAIAAPIGPLLLSGIADTMERKWQLVASAVCIGVFGLFFARQTTPAWLMALGVLMTCSNNWMSVAFHAYQSELFPTRVRARAVGFVYSWSRFSAIFTSLTIGFVLQHTGVRGVFAFIAASMLVVALAIGLFGPKTRGLALEIISR